MKTPLPAVLSACLLFLLTLPQSSAQEKSQTLEFSRPEPTNGQVTASFHNEDGLTLEVKPGDNGYPGCILKPRSGSVWDLSAFGHVEAQVTNTGSDEARFFLRVDNAGDWKDEPWNTEDVAIPAGGTRTLRVTFGYAYGQKPGFKLNPAKVSSLLLFTGKTEKAKSFRIASIIAGGTPGEKPPPDPGRVRLVPKDGLLLGGGAPVRLEMNGGAQAALTNDGRAIEVKFSGKDQSVKIRAEHGKWDLRDAHMVRVKIRNTGANRATPAVHLSSDPGPTDTAIQPIAPGATGEAFVSFISAVPWVGDAKAQESKEKIIAGQGTRFISDAVNSVTITASRDEAQQFTIESITAGTLPAVLPDWLGQRPPVDGEWVQTFREEFDGSAVNLTKWNIYTANYWDQLSHFSKDNVLVKDGHALLRYEKKQGRHNDDPKGKETPYASGFLDTYGKWVQRYGYFEARLKLPNAPGLWPAFWLMPDRGLKAGEQWKRASTHDGGMEFDVMEHLARWGRYRYNIAFHWDGYQDDHKQTGTTTIYTDHDREGFITSGVLWLPGKVVLYSNGREVARWESPRVCSVPCDLMFTHVMGGWDNNDLDDTKLPADFIIDYVRCWQRKDLASELDGVKSTQPTPAAPEKPD